MLVVGAVRSFSASVLSLAPVDLVLSWSVWLRAAAPVGDSADAGGVVRAAAEPSAPVDVFGLELGAAVAGPAPTVEELVAAPGMVELGMLVVGAVVVVDGLAAGAELLWPRATVAVPSAKAAAALDAIKVLIFTGASMSPRISRGHLFENADSTGIELSWLQLRSKRLWVGKKPLAPLLCRN